MLKINDFQWKRLEFSKSKIFLFLNIKNKNADILIWNYWFIIVPKDKNKLVRKIYNVEGVYLKELYYHEKFSNDLIVPKIFSKGSFIFRSEKYFYIDFENIRIIKSRFSNFSEINPIELWEIISIFHQKNTENWEFLVYGNLHFSNFFVSEKWLWVFDFTSFHKNDLEYDFATLYFNTNYDEKYLQKVLEKYVFKEKFSYKKMYTYVLLKIKSEIKYNYNLDEFDKKKLKLDFQKIKEKLCTT